jgi:hypothetical protein
MEQPFFYIIFRACDKVNAVNKQPRPFYLDKTELIKICFKSLINAVKNFPHAIHVLGDKLSDEMMSFFSGYNVELSNGDYGNDESIRQSIQRAQNLNDNTWVYFCEDDYLHQPHTFEYINELILDQKNIALPSKKLSFLYNNKPSLAIFPCDYPDRYQQNLLQQHFIFTTKNCHWRQVSNTTFTFLLQAKDVKKYHQTLIKSSTKANDGYLSKKLFGTKNFNNKLLCLSPIPSLTTHMHTNTMAPLVNWKKVIDDII